MKKALEKIAYRHSVNQVFDDFLLMAVCAFSVGRMEDEYLNIAKRYTPEEMQLFAEALGKMVLLYDDKSTPCGSWYDVLGTYFEEIQSHFSASARGQFFTPESVCTLLSQMVYEEKQSEERQTINDCACGSGRILIAHNRLNPSNRFNFFYVAGDLDFRCVLMCTINFLMYGMSGVVIHMNSITMEVFRGFRVWLVETGLFITPLSANECYQFVCSPKIFEEIEPNFKEIKPRLLASPITISEAMQLSLF